VRCNLGVKVRSAKRRLQSLEELGLEMEESLFPELLETFGHDAAEHIAALRSVIAAGEGRAPVF
jgi:hypothetical protein